MAALKHMQAVFSSDLSVAPLVSGLVRTVCQDLALSEDEVTMIDLSLVEAVNNAVEHAYGFAEDQEIELCFDVENARLTMHVRDQGRPMPAEPLERARRASVAPEPDPSDRSLLPERGMGLLIIVRSMDNVSYETLADANVLKMIKLLPAPPTPPSRAPVATPMAAIQGGA